MNNYSPVFNKTAHMTLWLAIADRVRVEGVIHYDIEIVKRKVLREMGFERLRYPNQGCFACEYALIMAGNGHRKCDECPLKDFDCAYWPFGEISDLSIDLGETAVDEKTLDRFCNLCLEIAFWPVKEGIITR